jgi:hypothetical protein
MESHAEIKRYLKILAEDYDLIPIKVREKGQWRSVYLYEASPAQAIDFIVKQLEAGTSIFAVRDLALLEIQKIKASAAYGLISQDLKDALEHLTKILEGVP